MKQKPAVKKHKPCLSLRLHEICREQFKVGEAMVGRSTISKRLLFKKRHFQKVGAHTLGALLVPTSLSRA